MKNQMQSLNIVDGTNIERNLYLIHTDYGTWYSSNHGSQHDGPR